MSSISVGGAPAGLEQPFQAPAAEWTVLYWGGLPAMSVPAQAGGTDSLTAAGLATLAPTAGVPAVNQKHSVAAAAVLAGAPTLAAPGATQKHALGPTGFAAGAATLPAPSVSQKSVLAAVGVGTGAMAATAPAVGQAHILATSGETSGPASLGAPDPWQRHSVYASRLEAAPAELGASTLQEQQEGVVSLDATALDADSCNLGAPALSVAGVQVEGALVEVTYGGGTHFAPRPTRMSHSLSPRKLDAGRCELGSPLFRATLSRQQVKRKRAFAALLH